MSDLCPASRSTWSRPPGTDVTVTVKKDDDAVVAKVKGLTESLNGVLSWIATTASTTSPARPAGPMVGDAGVRSSRHGVRAVRHGQADGAYRLASQVGLAATRDGDLALDETKLARPSPTTPRRSTVLAGSPTAVAGVAKARRRGGGVVRTGKDSTAARPRTCRTGIDAWDLKLAAIQTRYQRQFARSTSP